MHRRLLVSLCAAVAATLALSGCGETRKALGLSRQAPDEFQVVARAPLTVPPDFRLRPPQPGAARPQEGETSDMARSALTGQVSGSQSYQRAGVSQGEGLLLREAGAAQATAGIRDVVDKESAVLAKEERSFTDMLVFWRDDSGDQGTLVNATEEAKRIRQNQALGEAMTTGETPKIERRRKGILEGIF